MPTITAPSATVVSPLLKGTLSPHKVTVQNLPLLWKEFTAEEKQICQKAAALQFDAKLDTSPAVTRLSAHDFFRIAGGVKAYKSDNIGGAILTNGLGVLYHNGKIVTSASELAPENPQTGVGTGQGRSIASGGIRQPTAHLWKVRFTLPEKPSDIASLSDYQTLAAAIASDYDQISKGIEEAKQLAALALAQCEEGKKLLEKIGGKWAEVAALTDKKTALEKAITGLEALNGEGEFTKAIQKRQKELASIASDIGKATALAREASAPPVVVAK